MSIKAVIDTNVIVSAYWTKNPMSPTARIYRAILSGEITILVNSDILCEYREVLNRPRFGFNTDDIEASLAYFELFGENIEPVDCDEEFVDVDDKIFYCTAPYRQSTPLALTYSLSKYPLSKSRQTK